MSVTARVKLLVQQIHNTDIIVDVEIIKERLSDLKKQGSVPKQFFLCIELIHLPD